MPATQPSTQPHVIQAKHPPNRLAGESSPYLLQHAHNPVNWYPWGEEAFKAARAQDKLIFLSIGYSTCYWCHVMERESFENEEIAAVMNEHFICIKVDREERPDVDDIYMTAVQILNNGQGGWPMSVFLEPASLKPFLAGTYFPPEDKFGRPGFPSVLKQVSDFWKARRKDVLEQANHIAESVMAQHAMDIAPVALAQRHVEKATGDLLSSFDRIDGGFGAGPARAPKFPTPVNLDFLIGAAWDLPQAKNGVLLTLDRMATGGMYDQIGGGFHRYSVDAKWLVPHFEKMLYDNAQLVSTYARAFELTQDPYYAEIVRETLEYVLREMTSAEGAFFSAQDAEVNAREGGNYVWTDAELRRSLEAAGLKDDVDFARGVYGFDRGTNFQDPHHEDAEPVNVVFLVDRPAKIAGQRSMSIDQFNARLTRINQALLAERNKREQPGTDDKILAGWNGLMIGAMADGGRVLNEEKYIEGAKKAADFVLNKMRTGEGGLLRTHRGGQSKIDAFLEDYAFMIRGLIALHRATNDPKSLATASQLADSARAKFWDQSAGGYFDTLAGQSDLFVRIKSAYDGAVPCGNAVMIHNLLDLHELTKKEAYLDDAANTLKSVSSVVAEKPAGAILSVLALDRMLKEHPQRLESGPKTAAAPPATVKAPAPTKPRVADKGKVVTFTVEPVEINVKPDSPAKFTVTLTIAKGWHVNANKPGDEFLIPLSLDLTGCEGLQMTVDYPTGDAFKAEYSDQTLFAHHGTFTLPVTIEQTGKFSGRPQFTLTYQSCNEKECLDPKKEVVGVRVIAQR